jgi:hypothetical protein
MLEEALHEVLGHNINIFAADFKSNIRPSTTLAEMFEALANHPINPKLMEIINSKFGKINGREAEADLARWMSKVCRNIGIRNKISPSDLLKLSESNIEKL